MRKSVFLLYVDLSKVHHHWDPKPIAQGGAGGGRIAVHSFSTGYPQLVHRLSTYPQSAHRIRTGYPQRRPARRRLARAVGGSAVRCAAHGPQGARRGRVERDRARGRARQGGRTHSGPTGAAGRPRVVRPRQSASRWGWRWRAGAESGGQAVALSSTKSHRA